MADCEKPQGEKRCYEYANAWEGVKEARRNQTSFSDFLLKAGRSIFYSRRFLGIIGPLYAIPITLVVVGSTQHCPLERMITIFAIVSGSVTMAIFNTIVIDRSIAKCRPPSKDWDGGLVFRITIGIMMLFQFAWSIVGAVYIYGNFNRREAQDQTSPLYCNNGVYWYSFVIAGLILAATLAFFCALTAFCVVVKPDPNRARQ